VWGVLPRNRKKPRVVGVGGGRSKGSELLWGGVKRLCRTRKKGLLNWGYDGQFPVKGRKKTPGGGLVTAAGERRLPGGEDAKGAKGKRGSKVLPTGRGGRREAPEKEGT